MEAIKASGFRVIFFIFFSSITMMTSDLFVQKYIKNIRVNYTKDFNSKDATKRQIAVATYLIDKLALRAGNEKVLFQSN